LSDREQRMVFGEVAELYDDARPTYPERLVHDVVAFAGLGDGGRALEVGVGTGKATVLFATHGVDILGVEPDARMAAVARRNCAAFPGVKIEVVAFETWAPSGRSFDLVYAAQAWHWMAADVRCRQAHAVLRPGGAIALFWNEQRWSEDDEPIRGQLDRIYQDLAPELLARAVFPSLRPMDLEETAADELRRSRLFTSVESRSYLWSERWPTSRWVGVLTTQSDHRLLADDRRARLLDAVAEVLDGAGGRLTVRYETNLHLGRAA
jgi:SAM-dependent methyltransferase